GSTQQIAVSPAMTPASPGLYSGFVSLFIDWSPLLAINERSTFNAQLTIGNSASPDLLDLERRAFSTLSHTQANFQRPDRSRATRKAPCEFAFYRSNPIACRAFSNRIGIPRSPSSKHGTRSSGKSPFCSRNHTTL